MIRTRRTFAAAAATVALVAAGAAPALAERAHHNDAKKDVVGSNLSADSLVRMPGNKNADVTKVVMRHSPNRVIMRTHFRDLNRMSGFSIYQIRTNNGDYQAMQVLGSEDFIFGPLVTSAPEVAERAVSAMRTAARGTGTGPRFLLMGPQGEVECEDLTFWAHRREDVARMSIARSCLGNPKWVRLGEGVISFDLDREALALDDSQRRGYNPDNGQLTLSRRLQHP
jgi:hypothetical protein